MNEQPYIYNNANTKCLITGVSHNIIALKAEKIKTTNSKLTIDIKTVKIINGNG